MPPFLATLAGKIIGAVAVVVLAFSFGLYKGCAIKQQAWDAAIATQAVKAADVVVKGAENTGKVLVKFDKAKEKAAAEAEIRSQRLRKELEDYVQAHPDKCPVPDELVRVFDAPADRVPPAPSPPTGTLAPSEAITTVELVQALTDYRARYDDVAVQLNALIDWVQSTYEIQKEGAGR